MTGELKEYGNSYLVRAEGVLGMKTPEIFAYRVNGRSVGKAPRAMEVQFRQALRDKQLVLYQKQTSVKIIYPRFYLKAWLCSEARRYHFVHPRNPVFQRIPDEVRADPLQFINGPNDRCSLKTHNYSFAGNMHDHRKQIIEVGHCFEIKVYGIVMVKSVTYQRDKKSMHRPAVRVGCVPLMGFVFVCNYFINCAHCVCLQ